MSTDFIPDYMGSEVHVSPNADERAGDGTVKFLIQHYTGMDTAQEALERLIDAEAKVSSHYLVAEDGTIFQMVPEKDRAWHAGVSRWMGLEDINSLSIGIEIANPGSLRDNPEYPEAQIKSVIALSKDIIARHNIEARYVLAHSDISPDRKEDPGTSFPWERLHKEGVGHWVEPAPISQGLSFFKGESGQPIAAYKAMLSLYGYDVTLNDEFDEQTEFVTIAFQRHFRTEKNDGVADFSTIDTLHRLIGKLKTLT